MRRWILVMRNLVVQLLVLVFLTCGLAAIGCQDPMSGSELGVERESVSPSSSNISPFACTPEHDSPYPHGIPYLGIHGDARNSDMIDCDTAGNWRRGWHALRGLGMTQPNTFSPDGEVTYVTTTNVDPQGCRLFALDTNTGQYLWCRPYHTSIERSSVEVDEDGHLYFTVSEAVISLTAMGEERWRADLTNVQGEAAGGWGVHFTPQGHVATVTSSGRVYLLDRLTGDPLSTLDIGSQWGFVSPETFGIDLDPSSLLPEEVQADIRSVWGDPSDAEQSEGFGALLGSGKFVDNTVAVSSRGDVYVISGGPSPQEGAVVQVKVTGSADEPVLGRGWFAVTDQGSATTPSISLGDRYLVISDGAHPSTFFNPSDAYGEIKVYDIERCDANQDSDLDPERCGVAWSHPLERSPMVGAPAISAEGTVIYWEMGLAFDAPPTAADVVAVNETGVLWQTALPDDMDWSSVVTVTRNHVIGSASRVTPSEQGLPGFRLPHETVDRIVVLDRFSGELVWHHDLPDDSAATVTVGPDGSLYVPMLGIFSILAINERPTLGLMKFIPDLNALPPSELSSMLSSDSDRNLDSFAGGDELMSGDEEREGDLMSTEAGTTSNEWSGQCFEVNVDELSACCETDEARCVQRETIPEGFASLLSECDDGGLCVPKSILEAEGSILPQACSSIGGAAGVCLSTCLPSVAETAALLPQDLCESGQVCVPCVSPLDGLETGACGEISCAPQRSGEPQSEEEEGEEPESSEGQGGGEEDPSSSEPPVCCGGAGICLDAGVVPDNQERSVRSCRREGHRDLMCIPLDFVDPTWTPQTCIGGGALGGEYQGVCLSTCLKLTLEFTLDRASCPSSYVCAPCVGPLSGEPTGAPGCPSP